MLLNTARVISGFYPQVVIRVFTTKSAQIELSYYDEVRLSKCEHEFLPESLLNLATNLKTDKTQQPSWELSEAMLRAAKLSADTHLELLEAGASESLAEQFLPLYTPTLFDMRGYLPDFLTVIVKMSKSKDHNLAKLSANLKELLIKHLPADDKLLEVNILGDK